MSGTVASRRRSSRSSRSSLRRSSHRGRPMLRSACLLLLIAASCASSQDAAPEKVESPRGPRSCEDSGDQLVVDEPQVDDGWKEHQSLHARSAIVVTPKGGKEVYGVD